MTTGLYSEAPESREKARKDIQAEVVQVILPTEKSYNGETTVVNLKSDYLQLGDNNSIINMDFGTINDEAVSDFLSSEPKSSDKSRTILRVLRRKSADKTALDLTEIETERINIRAKVIQIIPPSETSKQNGGKASTIYLNVKDVVYVAQVGTRNHIYLPRQSLGVPSAKSPDPESNRFCLRVIRKPKSLLSGVSRKRHSVELGYNINDTQNDSTNSVQCVPRYNTEVDVRCHNSTGEVANTSRACQWETADVRPTEGYAKFWFRFYEPKAKYTLKFSLWHEMPRETTGHDSKFERKLLDCITVSLETGAAKTKRRVSNTDSKNYHSTRNVKSPLVKDPNTAASSLPLSVAEVKVICERFDQIMQILLPLRDNGEWKEFDEKAESLLQRYTDVNTQAVICLEQAVAASYRNEMTRAEQVFRKAWTGVIAASDALIPLLKGRAFCYLAGIRRRAEKLGDAEKLIRSSKQFLEGSGFLPLDLALLAYEEGSLLLRFMETSSCALKQSIFNEAKEKFDRCFQLREEMSENEQNIYNLKHQFAVMKQAMLLLNSDTKRFRDKYVDENSIKEATKCLDSIQTLMRLKLAQVQYCLVRADQFTRQHCYEAAESLSLEAWGLSRMCKFDTFEVANQQLRYIREIRSQ